MNITVSSPLDEDYNFNGLIFYLPASVGGPCMRHIKNTNPQFCFAYEGKIIFFNDEGYLRHDDDDVCDSFYNNPNETETTYM
ncbi:hypothetical protein Avbf_08223 [Armadillidium vulgare]|nr:hypothetical protein Avbf_08223 [Armadillidium vulgare]